MPCMRPSIAASVTSTSSVRFRNVRYRRKGYEAALLEHGLAVTENEIGRVRPSSEGAYTDWLALLARGCKLPKRISPRTT